MKTIGLLKHCIEGLEIYRLLPNIVAMQKILLVEDEHKVVSFIQRGLSEEGYEVSVALDGQTGLEMAKSAIFELIILDIMLPDISGLQVCEQIREQNKTVPILFLTALGTAENVVVGLGKGADDYLVKPFKFIELSARIKSLLRRYETSYQAPKSDNLYRIHDLELDDDTKTVKRNNVEISLTSTEYRLLLLFLKNKNRVLARLDILEEIWGMDMDLGTNVVDVYVNYLRKKIDKNYPVKLIHTYIGMGYVMKTS